MHAFSFSNLGWNFLSSTKQTTEELTATPLSLYTVSQTPALRAAVNIDPSPAKGGGDISIVGGVALQSEIGPSGTTADVETAKRGSDQISIYVVREGDSLSQIANMFGVSTNTLVWANDLGRGNVIRPGETLVILPVSGIRHTVVKGETLASIAKKYKGDIDEVLVFNNLSADAKLAVGDVVTVPYGVVPQTAKPVSTASVARGSGGPSLDGYFLRPVLSGHKTQGIHGYNAVDIGAPTGTNVMASASGEVILSRSYGYNGGYGQYIVIKHSNGTQTLYAHLSENFVSTGTQVVQGQVIGAVGSTGRSTGPHLHFEIRGARNPF
ncbi:hypothetical protein COU15_01325 [Candidatus Kaiserbacteria bacterium CG10_big_fil_rev_8_21_14_0_10_45_20]|uniref:LysM domain-containing protein n=1 Tax=Candidatus Kaiserbacteria bacterium CG10_big_fil_rev_8_21_14_0_10_45_20 TaxID=1974607 RepID=A0A2H0UFX9_9BACT|nr:MAG: hypothetical protein COU15_01325 [Candidatus Kaiserbacteria bacterium CG10_big_fil_rev_8_21_14_0_10_45_20]